MMAMRQFLTTLPGIWLAACIAACLYAQQQNIPAAVVLAVAPAFLIELAFYAAAGFEAVRKRFEQIGSNMFRGLLLAASALVPYGIESCSTRTFAWRSLALLALAAAAASLWYARAPSGRARGLTPDLLFLAFMAAVYLSPLFDSVYARPAPRLQLSILGKLMWIRVGIFSVLSIRGFEEVGFGFIPSSKEWRTGLLWYLYFLPAGALLAYALGFARFRPLPLAWWKLPLIAAGTFLGALWVVALAEEFFFRGFLQHILARRLRNPFAGLLAASVLFGLAHLPFREFPNWRFAAVGGLAGVFYGLAFLRGESVRAAMVTHACVVTTWRVLFAG